VAPDSVKVLFEQNSERLKHLNQEICIARDRLFEEWGETGSEQRRKVEQALLYQIEHDPLYAQKQPARESGLWDSTMHFLWGEKERRAQ